ncbi:MAG TPA: hypothetical protein VF941_20085 [Clostridia bacterium]
MSKKLFISAFLVVLTCVFTGCSNNQSNRNVKENSSVKSADMASATNSSNIAFQNKTPIKVVVKGRNSDERVFIQPENIKVFTTAIEKGKPIKNIPSELKPPPYFAYFSYSDNETSEYFLYINQNSGWIYRNCTNKAYTLSKESVEEINRSLQYLTQDQAIAKVLEENPEFPDKAGIIEKEEAFGPKLTNKVSVKYETKIEEKENSTYSITFTKTWGIKVNGKTPVSYWKYEVSSEKINLVDESSTGEELVGSIK